MLDKTKDYGECGSNVYGWKYYQNGKYFNIKGQELSTVGEIIEEPSEPTGSPLSANIDQDKEKPIPKPRGRRKKVYTPTVGAKK